MAEIGQKAEILDDVADTSIIEGLLEDKFKILFFSILGALLAFFYTNIVDPVYEADALLQFEDKNRGLLETIGSDTNVFDNSATVSEMMIMSSRTILYEVGKKLQLDIYVRNNYFPFFGRIFSKFIDDDLTQAAPFGLSQYAWGAEEIKIESFEITEENYNIVYIVKNIGNGLFSVYDAKGQFVVEGEVGKVAESKDKGFSIYISTLKSRKGNKFIISKSSILYTSLSLLNGLKIYQKGRGSGMVVVSYQSKSPELARNVANTVATTYIEKNAEKKSREANRVLVFIEQQLPELHLKIREKEEELKNHREKFGFINMDSETQFMFNRLIEIEKSLSISELEKIQLLELYTNIHPKVGLFNKRVDQLKKEKQEIEDKIKTLPEAELQLLTIQRDLQLSTELYGLFLNRLQELQIAKSGIISDSYIVDYALTPVAPIKPDKKKIMLLGVAAGTAFGIFIFTLIRLFIKTIDDPGIIEHYFSLPVYALIPHSYEQPKLEKRKQRELLSQAVPKDPAIEGLRSLRTNMHFALLSAPSNIIAITSHAQNIGKSFIASNFSYLLADVEKNILLIDADMRKGSLNKHFNLKRSPGLSEYLSGEIGWKEIIHYGTAAKENNPGFAFIATGKIPPNPSELLLTKRFTTLLKEVSAEFDYVIVDTPPLMGITDASIIVSQAGSTFIAVRAKKQTLKQFSEVLNHLYKINVKPNGVIFNDITKQGRYGYYYRYYIYK